MGDFWERPPHDPHPPPWAGQAAATTAAEALPKLVQATRQRVLHLPPQEFTAPSAETLALVQQIAQEQLDAYNRQAGREGAARLSGDAAALVAQIVDHVLGWGPLAPYMRDPEVEELLLNGHERGFVIYAGGRKVPLEAGFASAEEARAFFNRKILAGGHGYAVSPTTPHQDAQLPDGSRLFIAMEPLTRDPLSVTIRRFRPVARTLDDLVTLGTISPGLRHFLEAAMQGYLTVVIAGGTGTGKTTFLQALSSAFPPLDRVVTIEDTPELDLSQLEDWAGLRVRHATADGVTEIGMGALVRDALRMRPDRIILGEARGAEMVDILTACNTGHDGSLFTLHANSAREALERMVTLYRMGNNNLNPLEIRKELLLAVDLVVHLRRDRAGRRYVADVVELTGVQEHNLAAEALFQAPEPGQTAVCVGIAPRCLQKLQQRLPHAAALWQAARQADGNVSLTPDPASGDPWRR